MISFIVYYASLQQCLFFILFYFVMSLYELHTIMFYFTFYVKTQTYWYLQKQGLTSKANIYQTEKWYSTVLHIINVFLFQFHSSDI